MSALSYQVNGVRLRSGEHLTYRYHWGDSRRPTVLLLHGMGGQHRDLYPLAEALYAEYGCHRLLLPDLLGHGDSDDPARVPTIPAIADAIAEFLAAVAEPGALVVGHSLGAAVATALGARHPGLVSRLVLLEPGMVIPTSTAESLRELYDTLHPGNFASAIRESLAPMLFDVNDPHNFVEVILRNMIGIGVRRFRALGYAVVGFDGVTAVRNVMCPTMLVGTARPLFDGNEIYAANTNWEIVEQLDTSHYGLLVHPWVHDMSARFLMSTGHPAP